MSPEIMSKKGESFLRILEDTDFRISSLNINGHGINPLTVTDVSLGRQQGQFFIKLPEQISEVLPGSYIPPETLLRELHIESGANYLYRMLLGNNTGTENNQALYHIGDDFILRVFHGATNSKALSLTEFAAQGFTNQDNRAQYQSELYKLMSPVITKNSESPLRIIEDCLASGDTIIGVLTTLAEKTNLNLSQVRIDVAVATAQGILVLKKFAQDNGLKIELNVGHLAFGLSEGKKVRGGWEHANYITYPDELLRELDKLLPVTKKKLEGFRDKDGNIYVVGDMGDAAKSLPEEHDQNHPWNIFRNDTHGQRNKGKIGDTEYDHSKPTFVYLTNGGYLMRAYYRHILSQLNPLEIPSEVVFSAKRRWTEEYGYGVLLKDLPKEIMV